MPQKGTTKEPMSRDWRRCGTDVQDFEFRVSRTGLRDQGRSKQQVNSSKVTRS